VLSRLYSNLINDRTVRVIRRSARLVPGLESWLRRRSFRMVFRPIPTGEEKQVGKRLASAWMSTEIAEAHEGDMLRQITAFRKWSHNPGFGALIEAVKDCADATSVLEVGCGVATNLDLLKQHPGVNISYSGCDYSEEMIVRARKRHPGVDFRVEDATQLGYEDRSFDAVIAGDCLHHVLGFERAIIECARVTRDWLVLHHLPLQNSDEHRYYTKNAYWTEMFEVHFSERRLLEVLKRCDLEVQEEIRFYSGEAVDGVKLERKTLVCRKAKYA